MRIRTTTDPISLREVKNPEMHPCLHEGDETNGLDIYFENEENKRKYLETKMEDHKVISGSDTDDYVAEG